MDIKVLVTKAGEGYELLDSGGGEKLERYGEVVLSRPDPQALWKKTLPKVEWAKAQARFEHSGEKGVWKINSRVPKRWEVSFGGFKFWIKPSSFKHTGLFPEQLENWKWVQEKIHHPASPTRHPSLEKEGRPKVLNLFGYTGGATLAAAAAGAEVVHVDGSKVAVTWAKENAELSGLKNKPIRWIVDDALTFVRREITRGHKYDAIIMDPPSFGRGPDGEVWKIEDNFLSLLEACKKILSLNPLFILINGYASGYSALSYGNILAQIMAEYKGQTEIGEICIQESNAGRLLPAGIFARWSKI